MNADFPEKLAFLFEPHRYKVMYGGRGGGKSWGIAKALIILAGMKPIRVLCCREIQNSLAESSHQTLADQIAYLGLSASFEVQNNVIRGLNGSEFIFSGLKHKIDSLKSTEGIDICWVEEAQTVSSVSWSKLIPTIRKENSEIWISLNPELEKDPTYQRFVVKPPAEAKVVRINWSDNPWFPAVLRREKDTLAERDPDAYLNIWEGAPRQMLDGAIYAKELREAQGEGRICRVPYDRTKPVNTFWDLGWADSTAIWFAQAVGLEFRVLDYMEVSQTAIPDILKALQAKAYVYGTDYLPHDADSTTLAANGRTIAQLMRSAGRTVIVQPRRAVIEGINAARTIFPSLWFDEERCSDGLNHLRHYRYDVDPETKQFSKNPLHDEHSHACLTAGTIVQTMRGGVKIEDVTTEDFAWTPCGFYRVLAAGPVRFASDLLVITDERGRSVKCTPEHKVATKRGFIQARQLTTKDSLLTGREWTSRLCSFASTVGNLGFREATTAPRTGGLPLTAICTGLFTRISSDLSLMGMRFITRMNAGSTTPPAILNLCQPLSISARIPCSGTPMERLGRLAILRESAPPNGTLHPKDWHGTFSMAERLGTSGSGLKNPARNVLAYFARLILRAPSSAARVAKVQPADAGPEGQLVYDLTVEKHHCYQANEILVSNSDAFRGLAMSLKAPAVKTRPKIVLPSRGMSNTAWMG